MGLFDTKEVLNIILAALILGFIFSFQDWGPGKTVVINIGIMNLVKTAIISMVVLLVYLLAHKIAAIRNDCTSRFTLWGIKRYWFRKKHKLKRPIKLGIIIPLLLVILTNGYIKFAAVGSSELKEIRKRWIGKKYKHLTGYQTALIHLTGPLTILLLATILSSTETLSKLVLISYSVAMFSMLPFSGLDGAKIFFGSPPLYVFSIIFMIATLILIKVASPIITLLLSLALGIILLIMFLYKHY